MIDENDFYALNMIKDRYRYIKKAWHGVDPVNWPGVEVIDGRVVSINITTDLLPMSRPTELSCYAPLLKLLGRCTKLNTLTLNGHAVNIDLVKPANIGRPVVRVPYRDRASTQAK